MALAPHAAVVESAGKRTVWICIRDDWWISSTGELIRRPIATAFYARACAKMRQEEDEATQQRVSYCQFLWMTA